jgi:hypothetical protein
VAKEWRDSKLPTPQLDSEVLALPPPDPIVALRVVGEDVELRLSPQKRTFTVGARRTPEVDVSIPRKFVSDVHAFLQRKGNRIAVVDNESTNGIFIRDRREPSFEIAAGDSFRIADVRLVALDERLLLLRPGLQWCLGLDAHVAIDEALDAIAGDDPIALIGRPGCDQLELARVVHETSLRRGRSFVVVEPPLATEAERTAVLARAARGTAHVDLDALPTLRAPFVRELFGSTYQVRPIVVASDYARIERQLGTDRARQLRIVRIPPIVERREDVPRLIDALFAQAGCSRSVVELGPRAVEGLKRYGWPRNFDDLRRHATRLRAYLEHGSKRAAAEALGLSPSSFMEALERIGL